MLTAIIPDQRHPASGSGSEGPNFRFRRSDPPGWRGGEDESGGRNAEERPTSLDRGSGSSIGAGERETPTGGLGATHQFGISQRGWPSLVRPAATTGPESAMDSRKTSLLSRQYYDAAKGAFRCCVERFIGGGGLGPRTSHGVNHGYRQLDEAGGRDGGSPLERLTRSTRRCDTL
jgi:hypothetical protein